MEDKQKGSVLVFSLMLMLVASAAGVTLSILLLNEVKSSQNVDHSLKAYYAAETGLEESLTHVFLQRADKSVSLDDVLADIRVYDGILSNQADYKIDDPGTYDGEKELLFSLDQDKTKQIDLFDPNDTLTSLDIDSGQIDWQQDCEMPGFQSRIEVGIVRWPETGWINEEAEEAVTKFVYTCSGLMDPEYDCGQVYSVPVPNYNYRLRIKSLDCDLPLMRLQLKDNGGSTIDVPGMIVIKSTGSFGRSEESIEAHLPWWTPLSGLGDFVLFSQQDITK